MGNQAVPVQKYQPMEIHTERLFLRQIKEEDANTIVSMRSDPNIYRYFYSPHAITVQEHLLWYRDVYIYNENRIDWIALKKETPIGLFGLKRLPNKLCWAEISYLVCSEERGKGYAQEAVQALFQWAIYNWQCQIIYANIHKDNAASVHFIERMGFQQWKEQAMFICYRKNISYAKLSSRLRGVVDHVCTCNRSKR